MTHTELLGKMVIKMYTLLMVKHCLEENRVTIVQWMGAILTILVFTGWVWSSVG